MEKELTPEQQGDKASAKAQYQEAIEWYNRALKPPPLDIMDEIRINRKRGNCIIVQCRLIFT